MCLLKPCADVDKKKLIEFVFRSVELKPYTYYYTTTIDWINIENIDIDFSRYKWTDCKIAKMITLQCYTINSIKSYRGRKTKYKFLNKIGLPNV